MLKLFDSHAHSARFLCDPTGNIIKNLEIQQNVLLGLVYSITVGIPSTYSHSDAKYTFGTILPFRIIPLKSSLL